MEQEQLEVEQDQLVEVKKEKIKVE